MNRKTLTLSLLIIALTLPCSTLLLAQDGEVQQNRRTLRFLSISTTNNVAAGALVLEGPLYSVELTPFYEAVGHKMNKSTYILINPSSLQDKKFLDLLFNADETGARLLRAKYVEDLRERLNSIQSEDPTDAVDVLRQSLKMTLQDLQKSLELLPGEKKAELENSLAGATQDAKKEIEAKYAKRERDLRTQIATVRRELSDLEEAPVSYTGQFTQDQGVQDDGIPEVENSRFDPMLLVRRLMKFAVGGQCFTDISYLGNDLYAVMKMDGRGGAINSKGKAVIPFADRQVAPSGESFDPDTERIIFRKTYDEVDPGTGNPRVEYGLLDYGGKEVLPLGYTYMRFSHDTDRVVAYTKTETVVTDLDGNTLFQGPYRWLRDVSGVSPDGKRVHFYVAASGPTGLVGVLDDDFKEVIPCVGTEYNGVSDGKVHIGNSGTYELGTWKRVK